MPESILVVDDIDLNRALLKDLLMLYGYNVLLAENGEEGVRSGAGASSCSDSDGYPDAGHERPGGRQTASLRPPDKGHQDSGSFMCQLD